LQKCDLGLSSHLLSLRQLKQQQSRNFPIEPHKLLGSRKGRELLDHLSHYQLSTKNCASRS
jgi:hypothetical protein